MQRASGLGRAWIIAVGTTIPIDENSRFLALLILYVDGKAKAAAMGLCLIDGIRGNVGVFGGFYRLWARANGVTLCSTMASRPTSKESGNGCIRLVRHRKHAPADAHRREQGGNRQSRRR
jgi:hypothetical protein